jgi:hypothetical protein
MRPKRADDKYWIGTRDFNHIQYERDLENYIIDLENEIQQLRKHAVSGRREQLKAFADYVQEREWEDWEDGDKDLSEFVDEFLRL